MGCAAKRGIRLTNVRSELGFLFNIALLFGLMINWLIWWIKLVATGGLDLISLNKYVVTLIIEQANSCLTYNSLSPLPFIEKILLLLRPLVSDNCRYNWSTHPPRELFFQKFVLSSIIRCLKI